MQWELLHQKAAYNKSLNALFIADLHIGKAAHFRKQGIAIPSQVNNKTVDDFGALLNHYKPNYCWILGDLFHSKNNGEVEAFFEWLNNFPNVNFKWVAGNHDKYYHENPFLKAITKPFVWQGLLLSHEPLENPELPNLCGHIHPAIKVRLHKRDTARFPCFWVQPQQMVLPAFGQFTGTHCVNPKATDQIFAIVDDSIVGF